MPFRWAKFESKKLRYRSPSPSCALSYKTTVTDTVSTPASTVIGWGNSDFLQAVRLALLLFCGKVLIDRTAASGSNAFYASAASGISLQNRVYQCVCVHFCLCTILIIFATSPGVFTLPGAAHQWTRRKTFFRFATLSQISSHTRTTEWEVFIGHDGYAYSCIETAGCVTKEETLESISFQ